jgi:hypothetical protein
MVALHTEKGPFSEMREASFCSGIKREEHFDIRMSFSDFLYQ